MRRFVHLSVLVGGLVAAWPGAARSEPCDPGPVSPASLLFDLPIPGGVSAIARAVGLPEPSSVAYFVPALVQWRHEGTAGGRPSRELDVSLTAIQTLAGALGADREVVVSRDAGGSAAPGVLSALGYDWQTNDDGRVLVDDGSEPEVRTRRSLQALGIVPDDLLPRVGAGEAVSIALAVDCGPLPLSPDTWREAILDEAVPSIELFARILADRQAGLMYVGLLELDAETRAWLATRDDLLARLYREHAAAFAAFGRSLVVRDGRVRAPGGVEAQPIWEAIVGASVADPVRFLVQLLDRDDGALASFYDVVANLDPDRLRYVIGRPGLGERARLERVSATYDVALDAGDGWSATEPFTRAAADPLSLLRLIGVDAAGEVAPPLNADVLSRAFGRRAGDLHSLPPAALLGAMVRGATPGQRVDRVQAALFVQRAFGRAPGSSVEVLAEVLRGFTRVPALLLTLERAGVHDPGLHGRAIDVALAMTRGTGPETAVAVSQFQAALAGVERLGRVGTLGPERVEALVRSLVEACEGRSPPLEGAIAEWVSRTLLAELGRSSADLDPDPEDVMLRALSGTLTRDRATGVPGGAEASTTIVWEGEAFRADPARSELARLEAVRARQRPLTVTAWQELVGHERGSKAADPGALAEALDSPWVPGVTVRAVAEGYVGRLRAALEDPEAPWAARAAAIDLVTARMLTSLVYALAIGEADGRVLMAGSVADRHDLDLVRVGGSVDVRRAWSIPQGLSGAGTVWHVRGSLLALDVGLAELALRRMDPAQPDRPPRLTAPERTAFAENVALISPGRLTAADMSAISAAISRGRHRLAEREASGGLAAPDLPGWRGQVVPWVLARDPDGLEALYTLTEVFWLGIEGDDSSLTHLDAWGTAEVGVSGALATKMPARHETGRRMLPSALAARSGDMALAVAVHLDDLGLPPSLTPAIMARAVYDLTERAQPIHAGDALAVTEYVRTLPMHLFEDYVAALAAAGGPLVPVDAAAVASGPPRAGLDEAPRTEGRQP